MAGFAVQTVLLSARHQFGAATSVNLVHVASYSSDVHTIKNPKLSQLKRGTGGRSSFNGVVATVFGASGFLGRYVCNRLGKIGTQLIIPYRGDHYDVLRLKLVGDLGQVLFVPYDLRDKESVFKAVKYSNVVINLVGRDWETKNFKFDDVNVEGARTIANAAREAGVEKLIHLSALNATENPEPIVIPKGSKFYQSKWRGECAVREAFPEAIIFRPSVIYGQEDRFLRYYAHVWRRQFQALPLWKKGEHTIKQPVFVSDVAAGIINAVKDPDAAGKVFQAVGPKRYLLSELVDWFHRVMRRDEEWGYWRYDMRYDPLFSLRVTLTEMLCPSWPVGYLHWEGIEKEHTTDILESGVPTLEDLGVTLTHMEDQVPWELRPFRAGAYYHEELGEFAPPAPPNSIPV
ncbi:NADH dehydrogenase [ubiquinone] 1 alpha subcomplex subunit 9, mitochondrial [Schistocerca piceifrons]|uniref:NADH dehydrogenase [ubiquinone] 1 alpha subcomplex subunit 9, mitochondrial n=1 Tax=Schistocerca piceifrons TaxID=274613 RepID=UPI001F5EFC05|nr:NADH dehydrogenase [ubiquinone] 1 alpha subcomplex subunit 9, mitochondrial [Schistocerca piceifrons]